MSIDDTIKEAFDSIGESAIELGRAKERLAFIQWLIEKKVLRHSMVPGFYVIYTEDGPKDITLERIGNPDA